MRILIAEEAEDDLIHGSRFYERQSAQLGQYFLNSLFADIESLRLYNGVHVKYFGYYRLLSKRFPFAIYYRLTGDTIQVRAVLDCRQNPESMARRLGGP